MGHVPELTPRPGHGAPQTLAVTPVGLCSRRSRCATTLRLRLARRAATPPLIVQPHPLSPHQQRLIRAIAPRWYRLATTPLSRGRALGVTPRHGPGAPWTPAATAASPRAVRRSLCATTVRRRLAQRAPMLPLIVRRHRPLPRLRRLIRATLLRLRRSATTAQ